VAPQGEYMDDCKSMHGNAGSVAKAPLWRQHFRALAFVAAALMVGLAGGTQAYAAEPEAAASKPFTICDDQTYALCATAECTMFNDVAYCKCDVEHGDSISLTLDIGKANVCDINAAGKRNGYMVSTYSFPSEVQKPGGDLATYTCPKTSTGTYAQCDGGICWQSSRGQKFPGLGELEKAEIVCACPTVTNDPDTAQIGFQIAGPYPCQQDFFKYCESTAANTDNGSTVYVGAPTGGARFLTKRLYGESFPTNKCFPTP
jgi:hypothetical protein